MPERYEPLKSLVELRLDHNRLHTLNMDIFEHTTDLEILDLSFNPFKVLDQHTTMAIDSLPQLKVSKRYITLNRFKQIINIQLSTAEVFKINEILVEHQLVRLVQSVQSYNQLYVPVFSKHVTL